MPSWSLVPHCCWHLCSVCVWVFPWLWELLPGWPGWWVLCCVQVYWALGHHSHGGGGGRCGHCQVCEPAILPPGSLWLLALWCCDLDAEDLSPLLLPGSPVIQAPPQSMGGSWILGYWCPWCPSYLLPGCGGGASSPQLLHHCHLCWGCGLTVAARARAGGLSPCPFPTLHPSTPTFRCTNVWLFQVGGAEEPLLGYKCPTSYRLKGIYKRVVPLCHDSNFTPTTQMYDLTVL